MAWLFKVRLLSSPSVAPDPQRSKANRPSGAVFFWKQANRSRDQKANRPSGAVFLLMQTLRYTETRPFRGN